MSAHGSKAESDRFERIREFRSDFPALQQEVNGKPLAFLDSAASSQRARPVLEAMQHYELHDHANVHRGVHTLSQRATDSYEGAREIVRCFINAGSTREIIFTSGTTESINLVAASFPGTPLQNGDEILITHLEHHANIVPWQLLCERTGAVLKVAAVEEDGSVPAENVTSLITDRTRLVAISAVSNALGTRLPLDRIIPAAKAAGALVLVDGAQAVPHSAVDVQAMDVDFFAFSAHKMTGPTGVGVLYGRETLLEQMPPWQGGGDMIEEVRLDGTTFNDLPYKFEAGTPNISGVVGLGAAARYLTAIGMQQIAEYEDHLLRYLEDQLDQCDDITIIGRAGNKASVTSFVMDGVHPHDLGTIVDQCGVAVRTGHHCAMPIMHRFGLPGTARASLAFYNNEADIDALIEALETVRRMFR